MADARSEPRLDPVLRERVAEADFVGRGRISTVTVDSIAGKQFYHLTFVPVGEPLVSRAPLPPLDLSVQKHDPAFGIVKALDSGLIGRTFIGFVRQFAGSDEPEIHWHFAPDTAEVATAARNAAALGELGH